MSQDQRTNRGRREQIIKVEQQLVTLYIEGRCTLFFIWYISFNENILFVTKQNNLVLAESYLSMHL